MVRILLSSVAALLIALTSLTVTNGQTGPTGPTNPNPNPNPMQPNPGVTTSLAEADLLNLLKQLDPGVQTAKLNGGGTEYRLTVKLDTWSYALRIESFGDNIWIDAELGGRMADVQHIPSNLTAELLLANLKIGPTHFALMKKDGGYQLYACRMVGRATTVSGLRGDIEQLCKDVRETYPQWNAVVTVK